MHPPLTDATIGMLVLSSALAIGLVLWIVYVASDSEALARAVHGGDHDG